ncbi:MAG: hypothetical protein OD918_07370 [Gammaproteobacteria bacterium]
MKFSKVKALIGFAVFGLALGVSGCGVLDLLTENTENASGRHGVIDTTSQSASMVRGSAIIVTKP